jgi:predicted oxidoreductase
VPAMRRATRVRGAAAAASRRKECMTTSDALDRARESYGRLAWSDAYAQFAAADQESSLEPADLELLATAAYLLGRDDDSAEICGERKAAASDRTLASFTPTVIA